MARSKDAKAVNSSKKPSIKSILYLDEEKMYSISSQIFEGLTEYLISENLSSQKDTESQKGPIGSGLVLGNILREQSRVSEKKFLHDYSYTLFEQELNNRSLILEVNSRNCNSGLLSKLNSATFIKVTGKVLLIDIEIIKGFLKEFTNIGDSVAYVSTYGQQELIKNQLTEQIRLQNPEAMGSVQNAFSQQIVDEFIKEHFPSDKALLDNISYLLNYGYGEIPEAQITLSNPNKTFIFSAPLNRQNLRGSEGLLIRRYSRKTRKEVSIFGIITQVRDSDPSSTPENQEFTALKGLLSDFSMRIHTLEEEFTGKLPNEVVIEPIAIYHSL